MDVNANKPTSILHRYSCENKDISINSIVSAVTGLKNKILRLQEEIDTFKNENKLHLTMMRNNSKSVPSNSLTKNGEERQIMTQYELRKNFQEDHSSDDIDSSTHLSTALEEKTDETAVFRRNYPCKLYDQSIENDKHSSRTRVSVKQLKSKTYRESISHPEKLEEKIRKESRDVKNGDVRISPLVYEKSLKSNECQDGHINKIIYCSDNSSASVITTKIKRKRISRGVQYYVSAECQKYSGCFSNLCCFRPRLVAKKYSSARKVEKKGAPTVRKKLDNVRGSQNEANESLAEETIINEVTKKGEENEKMNGAKRRLDLCIAELNGIIGDAYAIFGNTTKTSS